MATQIFWLQFRALVWKNWVVMSETPLLSFLRCFLLPVAYGVFLSFAQFLLHRPQGYGPGSPAAVASLQTRFDGSMPLYVSDVTSGNASRGLPTPSDIMGHVLQGFTKSQLDAVHWLSDPLSIRKRCPQNFNGYSSCFASVTFQDMNPNGILSLGVNYTILADSGLARIDVEHHEGDMEKRILPLQWAIDKAIIELYTNVSQTPPQEWGYTNQTNAQQLTAIRLSYTRGIQNILALTFFLTFVPITYEIAGSVANERGLLITQHMQAMGLYDSARILSWHFGTSLTYLPGWLVVSLIWKFRIFTATNWFLVVSVHILHGLLLASWTFSVAVPFRANPQHAAVSATFLSIIFAIFGMFVHSSSVVVTFFSILFPPSFYIFALKTICAYENTQTGANILRGDPVRGTLLTPLIFAAFFSIVVWPIIALLLERIIYKHPARVRGKLAQPLDSLPPNTAVSIRSLTKVYKSSYWRRTDNVTAVSDLSIDIPKTGIFVMLGANGAGKSTLLGILSGISSITAGSVVFEEGACRPRRGTLGIVPQKNVLFSGLTCLQTLQVWRAVKWSTNQYETDDDLERLLRDCDLGNKIHAQADTLSGGQKRKLQLAIGLVGDSKIVLVDECTSGVDPLSRRAIWKTLSSFRDDRCIVFTTHFLDEADLLADHIAILTAPGRVVASGTPVALKRDLGEGYSVQIQFGSSMLNDEKACKYPLDPDILLDRILQSTPMAYVTKPSPSISVYHLKTRDSIVVGEVLYMLENLQRQGQIQSYDILGTTIEDIFLGLMCQSDGHPRTSSQSYSSSPSSDDASSLEPDEKVPVMTLPTGKSVCAHSQALTILRKRMLIVRRSWMSPLLTVLIAVIGATVPLRFTTGLNLQCNPLPKDLPPVVPLFLPYAPFRMTNTSWSLIVSPPSLLGGSDTIASLIHADTVLDPKQFISRVSNQRHNLSLGALSLNDDGGSIFAWEATTPGVKGPAMLNLASNILLRRAMSIKNSNLLESPPTLISMNYGTFSKVAATTLMFLRWIFFFGAVMAVYPAFYSTYVSKERRSGVQAMQLSNGLANPLGLWLGHLVFDTLVSVALSTIIIALFATLSSQFHGLGLLWINFILYGITSTLLSYCVSLFAPSPLSAFAIVAGYQLAALITYISSYLLVVTYANVADAQKFTNIIHFSISMVAPIISLIRATLVSVNLFSLLCKQGDIVAPHAFLEITRFGGPILYLPINAFILMAVLLWADSGSSYGPRKISAQQPAVNPSTALSVTGLTKHFHGKVVVDDVNLDVDRNTIFALLGPNGAGKTTTFKIISGQVVPSAGEVYINGHSMLSHPRLARMSLGVCPQFTAIDEQLTVREHLSIYGRLKGLDSEKLEDSIVGVLEGTSLTMYADRLASKLSGGNQRKLSLAICLLGNPPVILIDEFSSGVDPKMKRDMWQTLREVAVGKAIVITTHSMEEASALAVNVGILSKRMLALGTTASLASRYGTYEVQFVCRTREESIKARTLMEHIPGSRMADDVATRFEVPITSGTGSYSLAQLFNTLSTHGDFLEYTVERGSLENVFLRVMREDNGKVEELPQPPMSKIKRFFGVFC